mmetsp:Transcript_2772/g.6462  ORF Transcript_2772/g.6462 Transcript_2772/m.6462 type:complete len:294 (-) Transcript_2772:1272-2153(-)
MSIQRHGACHVICLLSIEQRREGAIKRAEKDTNRHWHVWHGLGGWSGRRLESLLPSMHRCSAQANPREFRCSARSGCRNTESEGTHKAEPVWQVLSQGSKVTGCRSAKLRNIAPCVLARRCKHSAAAPACTAQNRASPNHSHSPCWVLELAIASSAVTTVLSRCLTLSSFMLTRSSSSAMVWVNTSSCPTMCCSVAASASGMSDRLSGAATVAWCSSPSGPPEAVPPCGAACPSSLPPAGATLPTPCAEPLTPATSCASRAGTRWGSAAGAPGCRCWGCAPFLFPPEWTSART